MKTTTIIKLHGIFLFLSVSVLFSSCFHRSIKDSGNVSSETRDVSGYNSIDVSSALKVIYTQAPEYKVEVEADDNLIQYITTEVHGSELQIKIKNKKNFRKATKTEIHVSGPSMNSIEVSGASGFEATNTLSADDLNVKLSGASTASVSGQFSSLKADLSGASRLDISGSTNSENIEASGASGYHASNFTTVSAVVKFSGASSGTVNVQNSLSADLSGASTLDYYGSPAVNSDLSGASSINKK